MKLIILLSHILLLFLASCSKSTNNTDKPIDSTAIKYNTIKGKWIFEKYEEKTLLKSASGGIILDPDGTPVDTVKKMYTLPNGSYWDFMPDSLTIKGERLITGKYKYGFGIGYNLFLTAGRDYVSLKLNESEAIYYGTGKSGISGGTYTEFFFTCYLKR